MTPKLYTPAPWPEQQQQQQSAWRDFECWSADATRKSRDAKNVLFLVTAYDWCDRTKKNLIFFALLNANGYRS